ncbi:uncharacterized protein LOC130939460 [Arachis stenosperma]|uniref:uncharacterized protein LOC130939460 n=1 Tax=Arachis stenosperma TaxID=217475 RepID=UPI0025AB84FF|nr:uncharacterized protein LOC130939460 [Arachis stenosperma]
MRKGVMELDALDIIITQNKVMSQQINAITQHLGGLQVSAINTQDALYDMSGRFPQGTEAQVSKESVEKEASEETQNKVEHVSKRHPNNLFPIDVEQYKVKSPVPEYKLKILYPKRLQKASKDNQFSRFLEVFKKLQISILFAEALEQMPLYTEFMKKLLINKRNWKESKTMVLTKECCAIIQQDLCEKMQDPENFLIPCTIGDITI